MGGVLGNIGIKCGVSKVGIKNEEIGLTWVLGVKTIVGEIYFGT